MSAAGDFRTRLTLQVRDDVPDGQGGYSRSFSDVGKVWARVTPRGSRPDRAADRDGAAQRVRIELRAPLEITLAHRFVDDEDVYRVTSYRDDGNIVTVDAELSVA